MSFDPVAALEGAGVTDFEVDYTLNLVQLSANDLEKVTAYIWNNYLPGMVPESGFVIMLYAGWRFRPWAEPASVN